MNVIINDVTEHLREHITHELNGTNIKLVIQKQLYLIDLSKTQNRLNMPGSQLQTLDFLTPHETELLDNAGAGLYVPLLGPTLQTYEDTPMIKLARWNLARTSSLVLKNGWNKFVQENKDELEVGATIQVWSFRMGDQNRLCLAIAVVDRAD